MALENTPEGKSNMVMLQCLTDEPLEEQDHQMLPVVDVVIDDIYLSSAVIASSSNSDFISEELVRELGAKKTTIPYKCGCQIGSFQVVRIYETVDLKVNINGITTYRTCYVFPKMPTDLVFGYPFCEDFGWIMDFNEGSSNGLSMYR